MEFVEDLEGWDPEDLTIKNGIIGWEVELFHHNINNNQKMKEIEMRVDQCAFNEMKSTKFILFLDEVNTNRNIEGVLKEVLIDNKLEGDLLPKNFVVLAAANPYVFKSK